MKRLMILALAGLFAGALVVRAQDAGTAPAGEKAKDAPKVHKEHGPRGNPEAITLCGKLTKEEKKMKGAEKAFTVYVVTAADGSSAMVRPDKEKKGLMAADLDGMVGKDVKVMGMGMKMEREGKKHVRFVSVSSIELAPAAQ